MLTEEMRYKLLKILEENQELSQRDLARALGISLGRVNYCLRALMDRGLVKAERFRRSGSKLAYLYKLTPSGIAEKVMVTRRFLDRKLDEYEDLTADIERLREEVGDVSRTAVRSQRQ